MDTTNTTSRRWQSFFFALVTAALIFLPFVLYDGGYFTYYGDFNVQQIPFYQLAHRAVRAGDFGWSWYTDLGANFIGSYSFYLLFSPFFWLTLPFPTEAVPFLMAPLLVLKTACSAFTACLYLERFVRDKRYALLGSLLYAFSGWMLFNIFFNHFHDVAVFFPLLLLGVEELVQDGKKGILAFAVAVNAMVNYWFFAGEAIFVILYVFVRMTDKSWRMRPGKFLRIAFESVLGVAMAAVFILPSVMAIMGNPRTGADELLTGWNFWLYWHVQRFPAIIQSFFFPPELPARPNFFPDHGAKWASLSAWLPLFSITGVLAYFSGKRKDWLKRMLLLCCVLALVPGFNSLFVLLNNSYYARWFYMPILLMALATVKALEDLPQDTVHFARAARWTLCGILLFAVACGLTPNFVDGELVFGMAAYPVQLWAWVATAMACLVLCVLLTMQLRHSRHFPRIASGFVALIAVVFSIYYMANGKNNYENSQFVINNGIKGEVTLPDDGFVRSDIYDGLDNQLMFWGLPNIQTFHSIVPPSIMEFYPEVGVKRDVGSRPEEDYYALRPLLSVRWLFIHESKWVQQPMPGYELVDNQLGFNIYENQNFIPMGFGYDKFVTRSQLDMVPKKLRGNLMLQAIVLEDEDAGAFSHFLTMLPVEDELNLTEDDMPYDATERQLMAVDSFTFGSHAFSATSSLEQETILFFSVPWEEGWSAQLNGEPADILKVNIGFMGLHVPAGVNTIHFTYQTPGLLTGAYISGGAVLLWLLYLLACRLRRKPDKQARQPDIDPALLTTHMTWEQFQATYGNREMRRRKLQQALGTPRTLPLEEQSFLFNAEQDGNTEKEDDTFDL